MYVTGAAASQGPAASSAPGFSPNVPPPAHPVSAPPGHAEYAEGPPQHFVAQAPVAHMLPGRSLLDSLDAQERLMDSRVLHVNTLSALPAPSSPHVGMTDVDHKQERFRKTVMAAHEIVTQKLYKAKAPSLEAYFKSVWKISRAQVYRFLDCATVLTVGCLQGLYSLPN